MFAAWGIDYIKIDGCYYDGYDYKKGNFSNMYIFNVLYIDLY